MTFADKCEIDNLINSARAMQNGVESINLGYYDGKIAEYAENAVKNCIEVKEYIKDTINNNITLFFDISKPIKLSTIGGLSCKNLLDGKSLIFDYKDGLNIKLSPIDEIYITDFIPSCYNPTFRLTSIDAITVEDVFLRICHNINHPDFNIGYTNDLVFDNDLHITNFNGRYFCDETWEKIYEYAKNTRAKTEFLIRAFKAQLGVINECIKDCIKDKALKKDLK